MLKMFVVERTLNKATVTIYVDCLRKETSVTVSYAGLLMHDGDANADVPFAEAQEPVRAEAWLLGQVPYRDGTVSRLEHVEMTFKERHREAQLRDLLHKAGPTAH